MKKILVTILSLVAVICCGCKTQAAGKATIDFTVDNQRVSVGDSFTVNLVIDPSGEALDTARAIVKFPADKLQVEFFKLGDLYPDAAPGNYIDNKRGILSEGGTIFGGQVLQKGIFGSITFKALFQGNATISFAQGTHLIRAGAEKISSAALDKIVITVSKELIEKGQSPILIQSQSHVNQDTWFADNNVKFNWSFVSEEKIEKLFYDFGQQPNTDPTTFLENDTLSKIFDNTKDGVWYFHLKGQYINKGFTPPVHYRVMIDTSPPKKFLPGLDKKIIQAGETAHLYFDAIDETSGIDRYEVSINNGAPEIQISPYTISDLKIGRPTIFVKAIDKAGNSTLSHVKLTIIPNVALQQAVSGVFSHWLRYVLAIIVVIGVLSIYLLIVLKKK